MNASANHEPNYTNRISKFQQSILERQETIYMERVKKAKANDNQVADIFMDDEPEAPIIAQVSKPKIVKVVKKVVVKKSPPVDPSKFIMEGDSDIFDMISSKF